MGRTTLVRMLGSLVLGASLLGSAASMAAGTASAAPPSGVGHAGHYMPPRDGSIRPSGIIIWGHDGHKGVLLVPAVQHKGIFLLPAVQHKGGRLDDGSGPNVPHLSGIIIPYVVVAPDRVVIDGHAGHDIPPRDG